MSIRRRAAILPSPSPLRLKRDGNGRPAPSRAEQRVHFRRAPPAARTPCSIEPLQRPRLGHRARLSSPSRRSLSLKRPLPAVSSCDGPRYLIFWASAPTLLSGGWVGFAFSASLSTLLFRRQFSSYTTHSHSSQKLPSSALVPTDNRVCSYVNSGAPPSPITIPITRRHPAELGLTPHLPFSSSQSGDAQTPPEQQQQQHRQRQHQRQGRRLLR